VRRRSIPVRWTMRKLPWPPINSLAILKLMTITPSRGEVWLLISVWRRGFAPPLWSAWAMAMRTAPLITILPHTTSLRGSQYEITVNVPFLKAGAFLVQNVATYPNVRAIRRLGALKPDQFNLVFAGLLRWLGDSRV
jgi:mRNA interferase MazF